MKTKLIPKGQNAFANGIQYIGDKVWDGTKWIAHQINKYGNSKSTLPGSTAAIYAKQDLTRAIKIKHPNWSDTQVEQEYKRLAKIAYDKRPTKAEMAAGAALVSDIAGPFLGGYGKVAQGVTSGVDKMYDWAAAIDEPKPSNFAHVGTNYLEKVAEVIPGKADNYVAKGLNLIGNIDDAFSSSGANLFEWMDKSHKITPTTASDSVAESTYVKKPEVRQILVKKEKPKKENTYIEEFKKFTPWQQD